jgi:hypothetical protein
MKNDLAIFEGYQIRRHYDEKTETWWFSVVDIIRVLTQQPDFTTARKYWNKLKERLGKEGSQLVTDCHRLKLATDGKSDQTRYHNLGDIIAVVYRAYAIVQQSAAQLQLDPSESLAIMPPSVAQFGTPSVPPIVQRSIAQILRAHNVLLMQLRRSFAFIGRQCRLEVEGAPTPPEGTDK